MNETIYLSKKSESLLSVASEDSGILRELSEYFTFYADGYKFMPAFRNKLWDGKIRLYNQMNKTIPHGLKDEVLRFGQDRGYDVSLSSDIENRYYSEMIENLQRNKQ